MHSSINSEVQRITSAWPHKAAGKVIALLLSPSQVIRVNDDCCSIVRLDRTGHVTMLSQSPFILRSFPKLQLHG